MSIGRWLDCVNHHHHRFFTDNDDEDEENNDSEDKDSDDSDDEGEGTLTAVEFQSSLLNTTPSFTVSFWLWLKRIVIIIMIWL